jgi:hypothetical protein
LEQIYKKYVGSLNGFEWTATLGYVVFDHDLIIAKFRPDHHNSGRLCAR